MVISVVTPPDANYGRPEIGKETRPDLYLRKAADEVTTYRSGRDTLGCKIIADEALLSAP